MDDAIFPASLTKIATHDHAQAWDRTATLAVMNGLAERFTLELFTGVQHVAQEFRVGQPVTSIQDKGPTSRVGRRITFVPDRTILSQVEAFSVYPLIGHARTLAALNPGLHIRVHDERDRNVSAIVYRDGIRSYLAELTYPRDIQLGSRFYCRHDASNIMAEAAIHWYPREPMTVWSYVNGYPTPAGGSHITGMWQGLANALDRFAREHRIFADDMPHLRVRDLPPTLAAIISVTAEQTKYADTMGNALADRAIMRFVRQMLIEQLPVQLTAQYDFVTDWAKRHARFAHNPANYE
jgi:DNA gyrase/topoisomerase IV subunit B